MIQAWQPVFQEQKTTRSWTIGNQALGQGTCGAVGTCLPQLLPSSSGGLTLTDCDGSFMYQLDWATGCPDVWSDSILGVSVRVLQDETNT